MNLTEKLAVIKKIIPHIRIDGASKLPTLFLDTQLTDQEVKVSTGFFKFIISEIED